MLARFEPVDLNIPCALWRGTAWRGVACSLSLSLYLSPPSPLPSVPETRTIEPPSPDYQIPFRRCFIEVGESLVLGWRSLLGDWRLTTIALGNRALQTSSVFPRDPHPLYLPPPLVHNTPGSSIGLYDDDDHRMRPIISLYLPSSSGSTETR